jgi:hypothetical protein
LAQALDPLREWWMSRQQIIEEALAMVAGAFQRIHNKEVGSAA